MPLLKLLFQFLSFPVPFPFLTLHFTVVLRCSAVLPECSPCSLWRNCPSRAGCGSALTYAARENLLREHIEDSSEMNPVCQADVRTFLSNKPKKEQSVCVSLQVFFMPFHDHYHSAMKVLHLFFEISGGTTSYKILSLQYFQSWILTVWENKWIPLQLYPVDWVRFEVSLHKALHQHR